MEEPLAIGRPTPRHDGARKATGRERYAADLFPEGFLWVGAVRAGLPHARILSVDTTPAAGLPGVTAVLTARDVPGTNRQGIVHKDQPVLAETFVRFEGEAVALVLAETREALARGLALVRVALEPLEAVDSPEAALAPDAVEAHEGGNRLVEATIQKGEGSAALDRCAHLVDVDVVLPFQAHGFLEPENGIAQIGPDGVLRLTVSTQSPFRDRFEIAGALGLDPARIEVRALSLGGGFGGKDGATVQCLLALAALHAGGRPVKMVWEREEHFRAGTKRHGARIRVRLGALEEGTLHAVHADLTYDTGAYAHLGGEVLELGMEHAMGPYRIPHVCVEGRAIYTNHPVGGAMRGFGVCQATVGIERAMEELARRMGRDPLQFRIDHALRRGDGNGCGVTLVHSTALVECLKGLQAHSFWRDRERWKREAPTDTRRGTGVAAVWNAMGYGRGLPDSAIARVELTEQGLIRIYNGVVDMGQGNASAFVQIAGEILCQPGSVLELVQPDTARCHPSGSSSAGRTTYTFGNALRGACEALRDKLLHRAALVLSVDDPRSMALVPVAVRHLPTGREVPLPRLAALFPPEDRSCMAHWVMPVAQDGLENGKGFLIGYPHVLFAFGAHLARVEVDELTGRVRVADYLAFTDGGCVLNPLDHRGQVQGAVAQGLGYALMEEVLLEGGRILNPSFQDYLMPTALDVPVIQSVPVASLETTGPFGMKGIGEVGVNGPVPAVGSALRDALGRWPEGPPFTAERVLSEVPCG